MIIYVHTCTVYIIINVYTYVSVTVYKVEENKMNCRVYVYKKNKLSIDTIVNQILLTW